MIARIISSRTPVEIRNEKAPFALSEQQVDELAAKYEEFLNRHEDIQQGKTPRSILSELLDYLNEKAIHLHTWGLAKVYSPEKLDEKRQRAQFLTTQSLAHLYDQLLQPETQQVPLYQRLQEYRDELDWMDFRTYAEAISHEYPYAKLLSK